MVASLFSRKGKAQTAIANARRHATAYLDSEYPTTPLNGSASSACSLRSVTRPLLGPKYRQMVRDEPALMELLERAAAKHDQAVERGQAEPFTRRLTS